MKTVTHPRHHRYDVIVAGARCAGASTALLLARQGARVLVVDPLPRGRDTLSTHALMRGGVLQLHRWGLLDGVRASGAPRITATTFDYGDEVITVPIKEKDGVDALMAPRRTHLDALLAAAAEDAGAEVIHGLSLVSLSRDRGGRVDGAWILERDREAFRISADLVVGADGVRSRTARLAGAEIQFEGSHATASMYGYWPGLPDHEYRWSFRPGMGAGIIPTHQGEACVFVSVPPASLARAGRRGLEDLFAAQLHAADPALADRIPHARRSGPLRAFPGRPGFLRRAFGPGWALVGDAGYFRDPLTAHGISDALRDAELLARAVFRGTPEALRDYQDARDAVGRGLLEVTDDIASLAWTLEEVQALHHRLNREMNAGIELIRSWDRGGPSAAEAA
ncbi:MAG TPA: NAD(P)/FAD-dependent oxidoreductase [Longimicrobiales bacterium]|nr:NAD(P)/FAD-dependent oxidoreductase [Longimicrobiales bacterium]